MDSTGKRRIWKYKFKFFALVKMEKGNCFRRGSRRAERTQAPQAHFPLACIQMEERSIERVSQTDPRVTGPSMAMVSFHSRINHCFHLKKKKAKTTTSRLLTPPDFEIFRGQFLALGFPSLLRLTSPSATKLNKDPQ